MTEEFPNKAFFLGWRGDKEVAIVKGGEDNPNEWGFLWGHVRHPPIPEEIEMIFRERYFVEILIDNLKKIRAEDLGLAVREFNGSPFYSLNIIQARTKGLGQVFFVRRFKPGTGLEILNVNGFTDVSVRTKLVLELPLIQGRL